MRGDHYTWRGKRNKRIQGGRSGHLVSDKEQDMVGHHWPAGIMNVHRLYSKKHLLLEKLFHFHCQIWDMVLLKIQVDLLKHLVELSWPLILTSHIGLTQESLGKVPAQTKMSGFFSLIGFLHWLLCMSPSGNVIRGTWIDSTCISITNGDFEAGHWQQVKQVFSSIIMDCGFVTWHIQIWWWLISSSWKMF